MGMKRSLKMLDNRNIVLTSPGEIIKGEGMPTYRDPFNKGKLIIIFNISYPDKIDPAAAKKIASLLPSPKLPPVPKDGEEVHLEEFDGQATWGGEKTQHNDDYAEEEVHPGMQGGPQCKQM